MKKLKKIHSDKIDHGDKRFDYGRQATGSDWVLPVFLEEGRRYVPVIDSKSAQTGEINAFVYPADSVYEDILYDVIKNVDLSVFDKARVINHLDQYGRAVDKNKWAGLLRIGADRWNDLKELMAYGPVWQSYFTDKRAPLKRVLHFNDEKIRAALTGLLDLNPGINILEAIANLLKDMSRREDKDPDQIWQELKINELLSGEDIPSAVKLKTIRQRLFSERYPSIAKYRQKMDEQLRSIPRATGVEIHIDENFETPGMRLQADLRSAGDIEALENWLERQKEDLEKIIDIQKGKERNE